MPSLRDYDSISDRVRALRQVDQRPFLIVEGSDDLDFCHDVLEKHAQSFRCIGGTGRASVLNARSDLGPEAGVVAFLVDRDFDDAVAAAEATDDRVVAYDGADLEQMLLHTAAFDRFMDRLGSAQKTQAFGGVQAVRAAAFARMRPLQALRRANALNRLGLPFDTIDLRNKVDSHSLELKAHSVVTSLRAPGCPHSYADLMAATTGQTGVCPHTGRELARGKDALTWLGRALRSALGNLDHHQSDPDHLLKVLFLALRPEHISGTPWRARLAAIVGF